MNYDFRVDTTTSAVFSVVDKLNNKPISKILIINGTTWIEIIPTPGYNIIWRITRWNWLIAKTGVTACRPKTDKTVGGNIKSGINRIVERKFKTYLPN
jgi:hypothetical protein